MDDASTWQKMGATEFVSLTTFRSTGDPVPTPVWLAPDGDALVVTTGARSGKVKRLRRDARVELRPCSRRGEVAPGAPVVSGHAQVLVAPDALEDAHRVLRGKYRLQFRLVMLAERVMRRGHTERVIVRVTPDR